MKKAGAGAAVLLVALLIWWLFFRRKSEDQAAAELGTSGSSTLGIAELYFDPGVDFPADPIVGDVKHNGATP